MWLAVGVLAILSLALPTALLSKSRWDEVFDPGAWYWLVWGDWLWKVVVVLATSCVLVAAAGTATSGHRPILGPAFATALRRFVPFVAMTVFISVFAGLMTMLFWAVGRMFGAAAPPHTSGLFPELAGFLGLSIATMLTFVAPVACVLERRGPRRAIVRSWELTRFARWRVLGLVLALGALGRAIRHVAEMWSEGDAVSSPEAVERVVVVSAVSGLHLLLTAVLSVVAYRELLRVESDDFLEEAVLTFD